MKQKLEHLKNVLQNPALGNAMTIVDELLFDLNNSLEAPFKALKSEMGTFGAAIYALKNGNKVSRKGWNGKGMFLFLRPGDKLTFNIVDNAKSLPDSFKKWAYDEGIENGNTEFEFLPYICMKAANDEIVNGWLASQTDILADDWGIVE